MAKSKNVESIEPISDESKVAQEKVAALQFEVNTLQTKIEQQDALIKSLMEPLFRFRRLLIISESRDGARHCADLYAQIRKYLGVWGDDEDARLRGTK